jgi:hypothetical protein
MKFELKSYGHTLRWHELILTTDNCKITEEVSLDNITSEAADLFVDCVWAETSAFSGKCAGDIIQKLIDLHYLDFDDVVNFVKYTKAQEEG